MRWKLSLVVNYFEKFFCFAIILTGKRLQKMKKFLISNWRYLIFIPIIIVLIVGIYFSLPEKSENSPLYIVASDVEANVGDIVKVDYTVSNEQAVCSLSVLNSNVALVENDMLLCVGEGKTKLVIEARYGNEITEKTVNLTISQNANDDVDDDNQTDILQNIKIICDGKEIGFLSMSTDENKILTINCDGAIDVTCSNKDLNIKEISYLKNAFVISCKVKGYYKLAIKTDSEICEFDVYVN